MLLMLCALPSAWNSLSNLLYLTLPHLSQNRSGDSSFWSKILPAGSHSNLCICLRYHLSRFIESMCSCKMSHRRLWTLQMQKLCSSSSWPTVLTCLPLMQALIKSMVNQTILRIRFLLSSSSKRKNQKIQGQGLPWWCSGWESACQCRGHGFEPWSGRIPHAAEQLGPWATITEPARLEPVLRNKRGRDSERPTHCDEEWPPLAATGESPRTETKTQHSHK